MASCIFGCMGALPKNRVEVEKSLQAGIAELVWSEVGDFHDLRWLFGTQRIKYEGDPKVPGAKRTFRTGGVETLRSLDENARRLTWSLNRFPEYEGGIQVTGDKLKFWIEARCPEFILEIAERTAEAQLAAVVSFAEQRLRLSKAFISVNPQITVKDAEAYEQAVAEEARLLRKLMASGDLFQFRLDFDREAKTIRAYAVWKDFETQRRHMTTSFFREMRAELGAAIDVSGPSEIHWWIHPDLTPEDRQQCGPVVLHTRNECAVFLCTNVMDAGRDNIVLFTEMPLKADEVDECDRLVGEMKALVRPLSKSGDLQDVRFHLDRAAGKLYSLQVFSSRWDFERLVCGQDPYRAQLNGLAVLADGPTAGILFGPSYAETPGDNIEAYCRERGIRICKPNLVELLCCKPRLTPMPAHVHAFPSETKDRVHALLGRLDRYTSTVLDLLPRRVLNQIQSAEAEPYIVPEPHLLRSCEDEVMIGDMPFWIGAEDDYFGRQTLMDRILFGTLANSVLFPIDDKFLDVPDELVDCMMAELLFSRIIPPPNHFYPELSSDAALERAIMSGVLSLWVKDDPDGDLKVDYSSIANFEPREGFRRLGATAYLDMNGKLTSIYVCDKRAMVRRGEDGWADAKMVFKTSGALWNTTVDHLVGVHMVATNCVVNAAVNTLPPTHTIRRLLQPFSFRSVYVNKRSVQSLLDPHSIVLHACGFEVDTFMSYLEAGAMKSELWLTPRERIAHAGRKVEALVEQGRFPYGEDGIRLYDALHAFVEDWVCGEYASDDALAADDAVKAFAGDLHRQTRRFAFGTPERFATREELSKVLATFIFNATGGHEYAGTVQEYICHPSFAGFRLRKGSSRIDMQTWLLGLMLFSVTALPMPMLMDDFDECFTTDAERARWRRCQERLKEVSSAIDSANSAKRPYPFKSFLPSLLESAVSL